MTETITVLIPTYRRVKDLRRGLESFKAQKKAADEIIVTVRDTDEETQAFLREYDAGKLPLKAVSVTIPGVVAAMNAGLQAATGDIIALTDDDTTPYPDWLQRIADHFASDPCIGGVGGRDWQPWERGNKDPVGIVQLSGRVIGNHHLGHGPARDVDFLKGANCAYRAEPLKTIAFDDRLLGGGAQVHWEMALGLKMRRAGWRLIYDPDVALDHHLAPRHDNDLIHRGIFDGEPHFNATHNGTLALWEHFVGPRRALYTLWMFGLGTRAEPGVLHFLLQIAKRDRLARSRFEHTVKGRLAAIKTSAQTAGQKTVAVPVPPTSSATKKAGTAQ